MKKNEGTLDRILRVVLGLVLLSLTIIGPESLWGLVGIVPLLTGIIGYCPLYQLASVSTCPAAPSDPQKLAEQRAEGQG